MKGKSPPDLLIQKKYEVNMYLSDIMVNNDIELQ